MEKIIIYLEKEEWKKQLKKNRRLRDDEHEKRLYEKELAAFKGRRDESMQDDEEYVSVAERFLTSIGEDDTTVDTAEERYGSKEGAFTSQLTGKQYG